MRGFTLVPGTETPMRGILKASSMFDAPALLP